MKIAALGDKTTLLCIALAGIETRLEVENPEEAVEYLSNLAKNDVYGIIMVTSTLYHRVIEEIEHIRERKSIPIIIEIPDVESGEEK